ncbi:uncharacterized protein LOC6568061 [Drosophila grimshawi]|uniref:GH15090 n=1 Tax=Drosophila grimshawi TaxID=7222 RepID=B4JUT3_DROGR|nr:uncharacterized protein LOC6568061 [Drosophila grimshawi]EDV91253.1 GH15090 [Drosophila grimshawi]
MRPVLFQFYIMETILNIVVMYTHVKGFLVKPLDFLPVLTQVNHYFYFVSYYTFTVLTIFASINICTGNTFSKYEEIGRSISGFLVYIIASLLTLQNAENDFHLMYIMGAGNLGVEKAVHPFFRYMRYQALGSLTCGVVYLMHGIMVIDVTLSQDEEPNADDNDEASDNRDDYDFVPVRLYVLGGLVQSKLEQHDWFNEFSKGKLLTI